MLFSARQLRTHPSFPCPPLQRDVLIAREPVKQWDCEIFETLNDLVESIRKLTFPDLLHESIPLNSVARNESWRERLEFPIRQCCVSILESSLDSLGKSGHIEVEISRTDPDVVEVLFDTR
jgi:hypothetical protein